MTEHEHSHEVRVPLGVLVGIALVLLATISATAWYRISGNAPISQVPQPQQITAARQLRFEDGPGGTVSVIELIDGRPDQLVEIIEPGEGGFIRGVLRSLARARRASNIGNEHPFLLTQQADGALFLEDPSTQQRIYLQAFGPASTESFKALLSQEDTE
ncbi:MAG: photosynthetic complex assembly protein PuhC [Wenzhouxiangella sp.]|jgi:putative photosynthetic complex assembly protein|nr:photosynthetic complex assembly protein PuhC [Wenzhouxiangella sp.]